MRKFVFFILLFASMGASAQWTIINGKQRFAKGLGIPVSDTVATLLNDSAQIVLRPQDSVLYYKFKGKWLKVQAGIIGTTPSLQQVTSVDSSTTHSISTPKIEIYDPNYGLGNSPSIKADVTNSADNISFYDKNGDKTLNVDGTTFEYKGQNAGMKIQNDTYPFVINIGSKKASFQLNNGSDAKYLLPELDGTIALTSQIQYPDTNTIATHYYVDSSVSANKTDTTNLSNRINLKLNITDTANKWVNNIYRKDGKDSIFFYIGGTEYKIKDSIYSGNTLTLQQVITNGRALTNNNNFQGNYSGTSSYSFTNVNAFGEYSAYTNRGTYVNAMGYQSAMGNIKNDVNAFGYNSCYGNNGQNVNSMGNASCQGQGGNNVNAFGATSAYGNSGTDVNAFGNNTAVNNSYNSINLFGNGATATSNNQTVFATDGSKKARLTYNSLTADREYTFPNKSGTFAMLSDITGGGSTDTTSLSNRINTKIDSLKRSTDSIFAYKNGVAYFQYKDSVGGGANGFVPYTGATQDVDLGNFSLNAKSVKINGTNGNGHIDLKHQTSDATATGSSTVLFANNNGDLKWKNDTKYYTTLKTQQDTNRVYTFQNKNYTLADSADVAAKLNISDSSTYFTKYRSDTMRNNIYLSLNGKQAAGSYLLTSDSSTYFTKYRSDTMRNNIYSAINGKQAAGSYITTSDTSAFQRKSLAAYSFMANKTSASATATAQTFKDTSGTYTGSISWSGTTPPSGSTNHSYRWTQIGKMVTLNVQLVYATGGSGLTQATFDLPSDCPTPLTPAGISGASRVLYYASGNLTGNGQLFTTAGRSALIINAAGNGYSLVVATSSGSFNSAGITVQYYTN